MLALTHWNGGYHPPDTRLRKGGIFSWCVIFIRQLVLTGFQNGLDTFQTGSRRYNGTTGTTAVFRYARVVDSKSVQSQDLFVIGYVQASLNELHLAIQIHYTGGVGAAEWVLALRDQTVCQRPAYSINRGGLLDCDIYLMVSF